MLGAGKPRAIFLLRAIRNMLLLPHNQPFFPKLFPKERGANGGAAKRSEFPDRC